MAAYPARAMASRALTKAAALLVAAACLLLPVAGQSAGEILRVDVLPPSFYGLDARPNWNAMGRLYVHGPSGNVAVGDISKYNDTSAPAQRLEVDGTSLLHGSVIFNNRNGESELVVQDNNPTALTVKDSAENKYWVVNSDTERLEVHAPLHVVHMLVEAKDNEAAGLAVTAEAGNPIMTFDTRDGAENVKVAYPVNAQDATDSCGTSTYGACGALASLVTTGGVTVGMKTFMTGTVRVADTTDATVSTTDAVDASVRLAGGLAVERSAAIKGALKVLDTADGKESGAGALYVKGGAHVGGEVYFGKTLDIESNTVVGGKLSVFYGLAVARAAQFGGTITCTDGTEATSPEDAAVVFQGGLGVGLKIVAGGTVKTQDTTEASDTATAAMMSAGGLAVAKDARFGGTVYAKTVATNSGEEMKVASGASLAISTAASEAFSLKQGTSDRIAVTAAGDLTVTAAASQTATFGGGANTMVTAAETFTATLSQGTSSVGKVELTDSGVTVVSASSKPVTITAGGNLVMSSSNSRSVTLTSAADLTAAATDTLTLKTAGYAVLSADKSSGAVSIDSVRSGSVRTTTVRGDGLTLAGDLGGTVIEGAGIAMTACGTFYGATQCADLTASGNNVAIAATEMNSYASVTALASGGTFYGIAAEEASLQSYAQSGSSGISLVSGRDNAGYIKIQQQEYSSSSAEYVSSDRVVVTADGAVTVTTKEGQHLTLKSEGSVPSIVSLNARAASISKSSQITNSASSPVTVATIRLAPGKSVRVRITVECEWTGAVPATLSAEFLIGHHSGSAPEPSDAVTPKRTGLTSASSSVAGAYSDGVFEVFVKPDNSGGSGVTKDFAIKVYTADGGSGTAPAIATAAVIAHAEGTFVSLS